MSAAEIATRLRAACKDGEEVRSMNPRQLPGTTWPDDSSWPPALTAGVIERRYGYHFRPENLALVPLLRGESAQSVVDLGAGSGSLLLAAISVLQPDSAFAVEVQESVADRLRRTLTAHQREAAVYTGDLREGVLIQRILAAHGPADLVVTNPPFYPKGWGRASSAPEVHPSTHCLHGSVLDFLECARDLLGPGGVVWLVYDANRIAEALAAAGRVGLGLTRLVWIPDNRPQYQGNPTRIWLRLTRDGAPMESIQSIME